MELTSYFAFVGLAVLVIVSPGPDVMVMISNAMAGGRARGFAASLGITTSNVIQGTVAAFGLGLIIVQAETLFTVIRWLGVAYLFYLGARAVVSAIRRPTTVNDEDETVSSSVASKMPLLRGFTQGFLSNITNPKVLAFYLSILPQFIAGTQESTLVLLTFAYSHAALGLLWLVIVLAILHRTRRMLSRPGSRRILDGIAGTAMMGFAIGLAAETA